MKMTVNLAWQKQSICVTDDIDVLNIFYTSELDSSSESSAENIKEAKRICGNCPVRLDCLQYALDTEERFGVWGGSDEVTRRWALSVDQYGKPIQRLGEIKCPNCSGTDIETISNRRVKTHLKCSTCALAWWSRRVVSVHPIDPGDDRQDDNDDLDGTFQSHSEF